MKYAKVFIDAIGYELGPNVVTSSELEKRITPMLEALHIHCLLYTSDAADE